jgi:hypothetical protein
MAGTCPPDECSSVLPEGNGMSSSVSNVHTISEASFKVPLGHTECLGSVVIEGEDEEDMG